MTCQETQKSLMDIPWMPWQFSTTIPAASWLCRKGYTKHYGKPGHLYVGNDSSSVLSVQQTEGSVLGLASTSYHISWRRPSLPSVCPACVPVVGESVYFQLDLQTRAWLWWAYLTVTKFKVSWDVMLGSDLQSLFCFRVANQADCLKNFILLSFLFETLHLIVPTTLYEGKNWL